jgi:hypothetical protein
MPASRFRQRIGRAGRVVFRIAETLDPTPRRARKVWVGSPRHPGALICVYRARNARLVEQLVAPAARMGMSVGLWALDDPAPTLSEWTVGSGAGLRMALLNRLWEAVGRGVRGPLVVADDDIAFTSGGFAELLAAADRCGFGLSQPGHDAWSRWNIRLTRGRLLSLARSTTFVEIGPLLVVAEECVEKIFPFPEGFGMGWGLDFLWQDLLEEGSRFGIVDSVRIRHSPERGYDNRAERARLRAILKSRGIRNQGDVQRSLGVWRPWHAEPPWRRAVPRRPVTPE